MHTIPCAGCGQLVKIAPGSAICPSCGNDLIANIPAGGTSQYYYARAELLLDQQNPEAALDVVREGLAHVLTSDLLLLAAILAERLGKYDLMRHSVSQIPLEDVLRAEGEWLLRAHQTRQRAQRQGKDPSIAILEQVPAAEAVATPPPNIDGLIAPDHEEPKRKRTAGVLVSSLLVAGLLGTGWFYRNELSAWTTGLQPEESTVEGSPPTAPADDANLSSPTGLPEADNPINGDSIEGIGPEVTNPEINGVEENAPDLLPVETATPPPAQENLIEQAPEEAPPAEVPDNVADGTTETPTLTVDLQPIPTDPTAEAERNLVDADPAKAASIIRQLPYDLLAELRAAGYIELATLPIDGQRQDDKLTVVGQTRSFEQREQLLEALRTLPGINVINDIALVFRVPDTYTVQEGDVLWAIAFRLYGDAARWQEIYELNQPELTSPEALRVGQALQVLPK